MLQEPMMNKLTAMRLLGMVDGLKAQEQDPASRELSFLERLGLLVDHLKIVVFVTVNLLIFQRLHERLAGGVGRVRQLQHMATVPTVPLKSSIRTIH
jgi:hypothetical protein